MGGIFLRRTQIPKAEIINDINGDLVNLYRIVRRYPDTLYKETEFLFASRQEFERLKNVLTGIKGRFILSLNATPQVKELFKNFTIEQTDVTYSISKTGCCNRSELIITN